MIKYLEKGVEVTLYWNGIQNIVPPVKKQVGECLLSCVSHLQGRCSLTGIIQYLLQLNK